MENIFYIVIDKVGARKAFKLRAMALMEMKPGSKLLIVEQKAELDYDEAHKEFHF